MIYRRIKNLSRMMEIVKSMPKLQIRYTFGYSRSTEERYISVEAANLNGIVMYTFVDWFDYSALNDNENAISNLEKISRKYYVDEFKLHNGGVT